MELACKRRLRILTIYRPCSGLQRDHALEPRDQDLTTQNKGPNPQPISCVPFSRYAYRVFDSSPFPPGSLRLAPGASQAASSSVEGGVQFFLSGIAARDVAFSSGEAA
jgi:hypothetical protein